MKPLLTGLINRSEFSGVAKLRRPDFEYLTVKKLGEAPYLQDGWSIDKSNKRTTRLRKPKPGWKIFEDKLWIILSKMGFEEMNSDHDFKIPISEHPDVNSKQIDVFAKDEGVVLLIECKASDKESNGTFRKDILEIGGYREEVIKAVNSHYGCHLRVGWIIATKNYLWNESDKQLALEKRVFVLTDEKLRYYELLVNHLGSAAKYQLLAEVFSDTHIPGLESRVPAIRGKIGGYTFFAFAIEPARLLPISFVAHRMMTNQETLLTYQRILNKKRLQSIREYVETEKGLFPNSIIINFRTYGGKDALRFDRSGKEEKDTEAMPGYLYLPNKYKSAFVIDGQHRLYGFSGTKAASKVTIPVIAFENLEPTSQARMFVDINSKQVKVPKNLLNDLYADLLWDSKDESEKMLALVSKIIGELNSDRASPLYGRIKSSSEADQARPITITTLAEALRKSNLLGQVNRGANIPQPGPLYDVKEPRMENSLRRAKSILIHYFDLFRRGVQSNWDLGDSEGGYLCTNNGLAALILVLKEIIQHIESEQRLKAVELGTSQLQDEIAKLAEPVIIFFKNASPSEVRDFRRQYGLQGQRNSAFDLMEKIQGKYPEFKPSGLAKYTQEKYSTLNDRSRHLMPEVQMMIHEDVIAQLKSHFGEQGEKWWWEGIPEEVRLDIASMQQKDPEHGDRLRYFNLIHYQKIISKNWELFKDKYGFSEAGSSKIKQLAWFDKLNAIRNKIAHPERGKVSQEEFDFLNEIIEKLKVVVTRPAK